MTESVLITQAAIARVLRAAKKEGAKRVLVRPDGTIVIDVTGGDPDKQWTDDVTISET